MALKDFFSSLTPATGSTVGGRFRDLCVVGLNRTELIPAGTNEPIFGNNWQDVTDEQARRHMALMFFAPRELDGTPTDPFLFLADDKTEPDAKALAEQTLTHIPLLDLCRMPAAEPGTLGLLVAADVIFHWDGRDNYVVPTNKYTWGRDVRHILSTYPKNIDATLYTNWDSDPVAELKVTRKPLHALPLLPEVWVNTPTFQEKNGTIVLAASVA
ncbi:MAG: hypothetical protein WAX89_00525, partial [Alphaproteobacteria bacterium]